MTGTKNNPIVWSTEPTPEILQTFTALKRAIDLPKDTPNLQRYKGRAYCRFADACEKVERNPLLTFDMLNV